MHFAPSSLLRSLAALPLLVAVLWAQPEAGKTTAPAGMVVIPAGIYRPLFRGPDDLKEVPIRGFCLDAAPVTDGEFLEFVRANPKWRRSQVKRLFADPGYLHHWTGDLDPGTDSPDRARQPVVNVSWFAAKAYAKWRGRRLPTTAEWELAAGAGFTQPAGTNDVEFTRALTLWYGTPAPPMLPAVRSGRPNSYGVYDLHGLIWEWTGDFNSSLVTGDARGDTGIDRQLFCGAGSQGASDRGNFPAFMRAGFRSSLKAPYTVHNLGFRCAADLPRCAAQRLDAMNNRSSSSAPLPSSWKREFNHGWTPMDTDHYRVTEAGSLTSEMSERPPYFSCVHRCLSVVHLLQFLFLSSLAFVLPVAANPGATNDLPPCCRRALTNSPATDKSLYQLDSVWTSDVGRTVPLGVLRGRPQVLAMFFTHCEYACPILVNELQRLEAALPAALRDQVDFLLVSFDPERDTPAVLAEYRKAHHLGMAHWTLLTGQPDDVRELAALLGINYQQDARGQFAHSNLITLLNAEGEVVRQFSGLKLPVDEAAAALTRSVAHAK